MNDMIFKLPIDKVFSPTISQRQLDQLPVIVIEHPQASAAITLQGAHLIDWRPANEEPVFWLSNNTNFTENIAIRGGIPICFPWFGSCAKPNHGFARILTWEFTSHSEDENGVMLTFTLRDTPQTRKYWDREFTLIANFKIGKQCRVELACYGEYHITSALHSYFLIGDIDKISVKGLGDKYIDRVNQNKISSMQGDLVFTDIADRIYTQSSDVNIINDPVLNRSIEITHTNQSDIVVWNAGSELSRTISDMPDNGYKNFVCVETARINSPLTVTKTSPARYAMRVQVKKL
ncbi:D-hexose-6-phosphate mutarotase [Brenneria populi]|uniref:Putative glucose-6-phosphate 1-epimerase n=1 Tax=Brenneria populi TaxID=1505588 RepID=A0ABU6JL09_9GAMM|nr:D-hexose-6-phosphate mutarotase [Brenneria populi Li et al. 2015]